MTIWTQEENENRQLENLINHEGNSCKNCCWSNYNNLDEIITCGHHLENFTSCSFCGYWTSKNDSKVKEYNDKRMNELRKKINKPAKD